MKKKGFTLVEIIAVIGILAILGTASFFGIRLVSKNIKISKLESIEDKILEAVSVYIETNDEARNNLYNSKNGIYVPLNVLQNEGLIDFQDIDINNEDYVLTMLGSTSKDGACIDTTTIGSWEDGDKTIYLCTTSSGTTNISTVGFAGNNLSLTSKNRVWFYGTPSSNEGISADAEARTNNYVMYNGKGPFKIYYIDRDDSLALLSYESFNGIFGNHTQKVSTNERDLPEKFTVGVESSYNNTLKWVGNSIYEYLGYSYRYASGGGGHSSAAVSFVDLSNTIKECDQECPIGVKELYVRDIYKDYFISKFKWNLPSLAMNQFEFTIEDDYKVMLLYCESHTKDVFGITFTNNEHVVKIQLKPCMKISSGNGTIEVPYQITNYCG